MGLVHFQHIALQHGVVHIALHLDAMVGQHMAVVFHMLTQLVLGRVFQPRFQLGQHLLQRQLRRRIGRVVGQRDVGGHTRRDAQADAHDLRLHLHQRRGFGVQSHQIGLLDVGQPLFEAVPIEDGVVVHLGAHCRSGFVEQHTHFTHAAVGHAAFAAAFAVPAFQRRHQTFETILLVKIDQASFIRRLHQHAFHGRPTGHMRLQVAISLHGDQLFARGQPVTRLAQVVTGHAFDLVSTRHQRIERAVFQQPFGSGFGADLGHTWHVVHGVTHQGLVVDHQRGWHAEFFGHASHIAFFSVHGVDDGDALVHQLAQVFVTTGDHHVHALLRRSVRQGGDHIVGLNTRHIQEWPTHEPHQAVDGLDLAAQIIRHG